MSALSVPTRNLMLFLLSMAAGCVDALAFLEAGVFPANMTGNSVVLATSLLHPDSSQMLLSAVALVSFCAGAAVGAWIVRSKDRAWSHRTNLVLAIAAALVLGATATIFFSGSHHLVFIILGAAAAMGMQSAAVQQLGIAGVATVFMTGTLTSAVSRFAGVVRDRLGGQQPLEEIPWLPTLTWFAYFFGAFVGGLQRALPTNIPFVLPGLLILAVALVSCGCLCRADKQKT